MAYSYKQREQNYFELNEHNLVQLFVFGILVVVMSIVFFFLFIPAMEALFKQYLLGNIVYDGTEVFYMQETGSAKRETSYLTAWAVDVYSNTPQEARYWFNPLLALSIPSIFIGVSVAFLISAVLPHKIGYMRQKIERETAGLLDEICLKVYGFHSDQEREAIKKQILNADLRDLHDFVRDWKMSLEDLKALNKALNWLKSGALYKITRLNEGIRIYLRFYFTSRYENNILGGVYIGAACLIIIIGLRGLKFIPSNEPSLVVFALGLEFTLLILYAFTLMYSRTESDTNLSSQTINSRLLLDSSELGNSKEVEKLLKAFVRTTDKND